MAIPNNILDLEFRKFKEAASVSGQPAIVVVGPDGESLGSLNDVLNATLGALKVVEQLAPAYEDNTIGVAKVEQRFLPAFVQADTLVKSGAGFLHTLTFACNDAAPTAGSIIVYDNTAESGTVLYNETFTTTPFRAYSVLLDVSFSTGLYVGFTTTNDVNVTVSYR